MDVARQTKADRIQKAAWDLNVDKKKKQIEEAGGKVSLT